MLDSDSSFLFCLLRVDDLLDLSRTSHYFLTLRDID